MVSLGRGLGRSASSDRAGLHHRSMYDVVGGDRNFTCLLGTCNSNGLSRISLGGQWPIVEHGGVQYDKRYYGPATAVLHAVP